MPVVPTHHFQEDQLPLPRSRANPEEIATSIVEFVWAAPKKPKSILETVIFHTASFSFRSYLLSLFHNISFRDSDFCFSSFVLRYHPLQDCCVVCISSSSTKILYSWSSTHASCSFRRTSYPYLDRDLPLKREQEWRLSFWKPSLQAPGSAPVDCNA